MSYLRRHSRHTSYLSVSRIQASGNQNEAQKFYLAISLVASFGRVNSGYLVNGGRGSRRIVEYRRIAHYLSHIVFGLSVTSIARLSHRHHTSVTDSCHAIEERRDDPAFDKILFYAEMALTQIDGSLDAAESGIEAPLQEVRHPARVPHNTDLVGRKMELCS